MVASLGVTIHEYLFLWWCHSPSAYVSGVFFPMKMDTSRSLVASHVFPSLFSPAFLYCNILPSLSTFVPPAHAIPAVLLTDYEV